MWSLGRFFPVGGLTTAQFGTFTEGVLSLTPQDFTGTQGATFDFCTLTLTPQDATGQSVVTFDFATLNLTPQDLPAGSQLVRFDFTTLNLTPQDITGAGVTSFDWAVLNFTPQDADANPGPLLVDFDDGPTLTFTPQNLQVPVSTILGTFDFATLTLSPENFDHLVQILVTWPGDVVMLGEGLLQISTDKGLLRVVMGTSGRNYAETIDDGTAQ